MITLCARSLLLIQLFILLFTAAGKFLALMTGMNDINKLDEIIPIPNSYLYLSVATIELGISLILMSRLLTIAQKLLVCIWLNSMFTLYRALRHAYGIALPCPCAGNFAKYIPINSHSLSFLFGLQTLSFLLLSIILYKPLCNELQRK